MDTYKVEINFPRMRCSWTESYIIQAENEEDAKQKCKHLAESYEKMTAWKIDTSIPYLIEDTSD